MKHGGDIAVLLGSRSGTLGLGAHRGRLAFVGLGRDRGDRRAGRGRRQAPRLRPVVPEAPDREPAVDGSVRAEVCRGPGGPRVLPQAFPDLPEPPAGLAGDRCSGHMADSERAGTASLGTCSSRARMTRPRRRATGVAPTNQSEPPTRIHVETLMSTRSFLWAVSKS